MEGRVGRYVDGWVSGGQDLFLCEADGWMDGGMGGWRLVAGWIN